MVYGKGEISDRKDQIKPAGKKHVENPEKGKTAWRRIWKDRFVFYTFLAI